MTRRGLRVCLADALRSIVTLTQLSRDASDTFCPLHSPPSHRPSVSVHDGRFHHGPRHPRGRSRLLRGAQVSCHPRPQNGHAPAPDCRRCRHRARGQNPRRAQGGDRGHLRRRRNGVHAGARSSVVFYPCNTLAISRVPSQRGDRRSRLFFSLTQLRLSRFFFFLFSDGSPHARHPSKGIAQLAYSCDPPPPNAPAARRCLSSATFRTAR